MRRAVTGVTVLAGLALVVVAPLPVVLGANRLAGFAVAAVGGWLLVGRVGVVDLASGASVGVGAYLGGVLAGLTGLPSAVGLVTGAVAGAVLSGVNAAVAGRVGRTAGALTSLALGGAVVAVLRTWSGAGGVAGFHAVPLLTGSDRGDLVAALACLAGAAALVARAARGRTVAAAGVAAAAPVLSESLGRRPVRDTAVAGAIAGAVLGLAGALQAFLVGSVAPDAYGLGLSAALGLAALLGGRAPLGPVVGALLLWGPGVVWPLVPVIGDGPVLLATGIVGLVVLALRGGRPLLPHRPPAPAPAPEEGDAAAPPVARCRARLDVAGAVLPAGEVTFAVEPGEIVVLAGPNGAGKSTLLARIAGQLPAGGEVTFAGAAPPRGARQRARAGVARTWQRPPGVHPHDAELVALGTPQDRAAAAWARGVLGHHAATDAGAQLVRLVGRRPAIALLDEPAAALPVELVGRVLRGLAEGGAAVLVVEHRPEALALADRVVPLGGGPA
ncbi:MAG: ATP-binding cassette domain-containing protein [Actinobacteria bacterium]|nr:ATP-binding cassette domain-containing protein [Actinomycetota bacterium]